MPGNVNISHVDQTKTFTVWKSFHGFQFAVLPQLTDKEILGSFCTEGQGLYPFQHILGRKPTGAKKKAELQPQYRQKAGITAQKQLEMED